MKTDKLKPTEYSSCIQCGKVIIKSRKAREHCSNKCYWQTWSKLGRRGITKEKTSVANLPQSELKPIERKVERSEMIPKFKLMIEYRGLHDPKLNQEYFDESYGSRIDLHMLDRLKNIMETYKIDGFIVFPKVYKIEDITEDITEGVLNWLQKG